jgi:F5/8 type C domain
MKNNFFLFIFLSVSLGSVAQEKSFVAIYKKTTPKNLYGKGQEFVDSIINRMNSETVKFGTPLLVSNHPSVYMSNYFSTENVKYYYEMIGRAILTEIDDSKYLRKIDSFAQNIRYVDIETAAKARRTIENDASDNSDTGFVAKNYYDSLIGEFSSKTIYFGLPLLYTNQPAITEYAKNKKEYFINGFEKHNATGAKISFKYPYDAKYKAGGSKSLVDGLHGSETSLLYWQGWIDKDLIATIDLGHSQGISSISISFLVRNSIQTPGKVYFEYSTDGNRFFQLNAQDIEVIKKKGKGDYSIFTFSTPDIIREVPMARYVRVTAKDNPKRNSWLLADEIAVK